MRRYLLLISVIVVFPVLLQAEEANIKWLPVDKAVKEAREGKKPLLIDFYAIWCGYCRKMRGETYADRAVIEKINKLFVASSVDIESRKEFVFNGKKVTERQFAEGFGVTATPTTWFIKPNGDLIRGIPGYLGPQEFLEVLTYVGEGWYEKMDIMEYLNKRSGK